MESGPSCSGVLALTLIHGLQVNVHLWCLRKFEGDSAVTQPCARPSNYPTYSSPVDFFIFAFSLLISPYACTVFFQAKNQRDCVLIFGLLFL